MSSKIVFIAMLVFIALVYAEDADAMRAEKVAQKAAATLGWPASISSDVDNTPGKVFLISSDGQGDDSEIKGYVTVLGSPLDVPYNYWIMQEFDLQHSQYMGKDAMISQAGELCNPKGMFTIMVMGIVESMFGWLRAEGEEPDNCIQQHGVIVWSCGRFMFMAADETDKGGEEDVAAAFFAAAQQEGLCEYGDTLVILAQTADRPGGKKLADFQKIAQKTNEYYAVNSYGKESFGYTFMDADGAGGNSDWYTVGPTMAGVDHVAFVEAAVKKAFSGQSIPQDLTFKRIIVVHAGSSKQADSTNGIFDTADAMKENNYAIEVPAMGRTAKISSTDLILVAEHDEMGLWAHEIGHSLWCKYAMYGKWNHIADRYNYVEAYGQHGAIWNWGLMGTGNWFGVPQATKPVHMSSFTKESAGWLNYVDMAVNKTYSDKALEAKKLGDNIYRFDDPTSNDANRFYIIEARDSSGTYSAPETGLVLYRVSYDNPNQHYIVNFVFPQKGNATVNDTTKNNYPYARSTMRGSGGADSVTEYKDVPGKFKVVLEGETYNPYTATFRVEDWNVRNMTGAAITPNRTTEDAGLTITTNRQGFKPDLDLHAYDGKGGHVGMVYETWDYENTIPGAIASGDREDSEEWIYVPDGTDVRFEVSSYKTEAYLRDNPGMRQEAKPQAYSSALLRVDGAGKHFEADGGAGSIESGREAPLKSPKDTSLQYRERTNPGFGNNSLCPFAILSLIGLIGAVFFSGRR